MKNEAIHTSTGCAACGSPAEALIAVLLRWLADLDSGRFHEPHLVENHFVITRVNWIWAHCLMQEWFVDAGLRIKPIEFKRFLLAGGLISASQFEKTIDGVRHTGMVMVDRSVIDALANGVQ